MVFVQNWPFLIFVFQAEKAREMCFTIFQIEKTPFQAIKTRCLKSLKIEVFRKGLTHGFCPKMAIFPSFFLGDILARKMYFTYSRTKKCLSRQYKQEVQKVQKLRFFQRCYPMVLVQKWPFFNVFFFRHYRLGKCVLQYSRKKSFLRL